MHKTALYPGSFDPITNGHIDVLRQSLKFIDQVVLAIGISPQKTGLFDFSHRQDMINEVITTSFEPEDISRVTITEFTGLVVDSAREHNANVIIRGIRDSTDFDYEMQMVGMNHSMVPEIGTVFIPASSNVRHISATLVRQIAQMGGDVTPFVTETVARQLKSVFS